MPPAPADHVDANLLASRGASVDRKLDLQDMPRVAQAGVGKGGVSAHLHFLELDTHPAVQGQLSGTLVMTCQRCCNAVDVRLDERFAVAIVQSEQDGERVSEEYEPVVADPTHLDVRWLIEEQVLLALPMVPRHEEEEHCVPGPVVPGDAEVASDKSSPPHPFANLRDLLRKG